MFKFGCYYYKEDGSPKVLFSLDWFYLEDHWTQRYIFDRPMWSEEDMERIKLKNENRHKWFTIRLTLMHYRFNLDLRGKKIGNLYNGRQLDDGPKSNPLRKKEV